MPTFQNDTGCNHEKVRAFFPSSIFAALLFIAYSLPGDFIGDIGTKPFILKLVFSDTLFHFLSFAFFTWFLSSGFFWLSGRRIPYFKIFCLSFGYGIFIEIWQILLPYRAFDFKDIGVDFLGTVISLFGFFLFPEFRRFSLKIMQQLNPN